MKKINLVGWASRARGATGEHATELTDPKSDVKQTSNIHTPPTLRQYLPTRLSHDPLPKSTLLHDDPHKLKQSRYRAPASTRKEGLRLVWFHFGFGK